MRPASIALYCVALVFATAPFTEIAWGDARPAHSVVLVTLDGVRVEDFFGGLDELVATHDEQQLYSDIAAMRERFGGETAVERRAKLMPRLWTDLIPQGMAFGNPQHDNHVKVQNGVLWSTPGYVEMLTGAPRAEVEDNEHRRYSYPTALEHARRELKLGFGEVAQFGSWDGYKYAAASVDEAFLMVGAYDPVPRNLASADLDLVNELRREVMGLWEEGSNDMLTYRMARGYLLAHRPRVMWLALVNSDDWAHADRYDRYLAYLHRADAMLGDLWDTLQADEAYRGRTTMVVTTDHGRGRQGADWAEHDTTIPGSDDIWLVVLGPGTPKLGEVTTPGTLYQGQVAATLLQALGLDWRRLGKDVLPPVR